MNLAQLLSVTYAERKRDCAKAVARMIARWGARQSRQHLLFWISIQHSAVWRVEFASAVGRQPIDSDRLEMIEQLTSYLAAQSPRGTLPRTHYGADTIVAIVDYLLDANSLVAADSSDEAMSEVLVELLATTRSTELRLVQILCAQGRRGEVVDAIERHHNCWMASREAA